MKLNMDIMSITADSLLQVDTTILHVKHNMMQTVLVSNKSAVPPNSDPDFQIESTLFLNTSTLF